MSTVPSSSLQELQASAKADELIKLNNLRDEFFE